MTGIQSSQTSSFKDWTSPLLEEQSHQTSCNDEMNYAVYASSSSGYESTLSSRLIDSVCVRTC